MLFERLPCRRMAFAAEYHGQSLVPLVESSACSLPPNDIQPSATAAENNASVQAFTQRQVSSAKNSSNYLIGYLRGNSPPGIV
ncbi:hypothetical protein T265_09704 [Opisthorchis viverrini]|uniref:Uncharacterized protein n=1 Tax=Opisthorchis viverrini TaxID=6198 RepID=A0A074Z4Y0_OPIVI|nr:hypothetical protein T265_09704 [Opisthorchis viverrini]KER22136.1 hypothetical protein T265_09704 [Opisthorchis viverrini]